MRINTDQRIRDIQVDFAGQPLGILQKGARYTFSYHSDAAQPVSVTMPLEQRVYERGALFPIFEMNIPEGYIRQRITERLRKHIRVDDMLFLALQGNTGVGCLQYRTPGIEAGHTTGEALAEILGWQGQDDLFETLLDKYLLQSSISGVQPKLLVPETRSTSAKGALVLPSLIVKKGDDEYPELAVNEYICMRLAQACGIDTPEFWLSDDRQLFVMRRFDLDADGDCMAMEDMAVLQGKSTDQKYASSYEAIVKAIRYYSADVHTDLDIFYKMLLHSCMVGNGDGHLKNYAMIYRDPEQMGLSKLYDVVNTRLYHSNEFMALRLDKSKDFPDRRRLVNFGKNIGIKKPETVIEEIADRIRDELVRLRDYADAMTLDIEASILGSLNRSTTRTAHKSRPARRHSKHP